MHTPPTSPALPLARPALGRPLALMFAALASACGGGGGDTAASPAPAPGAAAPAPAAPAPGPAAPAPGPAPASPSPAPAPAATSRIATLRMDFDANGVVDATETATYDAAGRVLSSAYRYTGDAVVDRLNLAGTEATSNAFVHDAQGRLLRLDDTQPQGSSSFTFEYGADGLATRGGFTATSASGSFSGALTFSYAGLLQTGYTQTLAGQPLGSTTYTHDTRGRRLTSEERSPGSSTVLRTDYRWDDSDRLTRVRRDAATGEEVYTMAYSNGRQTETVKTVAGVVAYRVAFTYDGRGRLAQAQFDRLGDGSVDAVWTVVWEDGPCAETVLPLWDPLLDTRTGWGGSLRGETARCGS